MKHVIISIITLLFYTSTFSQNDSIVLKEPRLNLLFLDHNNQPINKTILLKSRGNEIALEVKSDENGKIDVLIPTDNTYVVYLIDSDSIPKEEKKESVTKTSTKNSDFISVLGSLLSLITKSNQN